MSNVLRNQMDFDGLIFTDALNMKGATQLLKGSACVNALLAGNDVLLMPENIGDEIAAIKAAVARGIIKQSVIDERCKKMLRYKYALDLTSRQHVNTSHLADDVNSQWSGAQAPAHRRQHHRHQEQRQHPAHPQPAEPPHRRGHHRQRERHGIQVHTPLRRLCPGQAF